MARGVVTISEHQRQQSSDVNRQEYGGSVVTAFYSYVPAPPLSSYVDCFWLYEDSEQPYEFQRALPTGKPALWIDLGGDGVRASIQQDLRWMKTFPTSVLLGPHSRWFIVESGQRVARLGV